MDFIFKYILPQYCLLCSSLISYQEVDKGGLCTDCLARIGKKALQGRRCTCCSYPLLSEQEVCMHCRERQWYFKRQVSLFLYRNDLKLVLRLIKFDKEKPLYFFFAPLLFRIYKEYFPDFCLVPVPSSRKFFELSLTQEMALLLKKRYQLPVADLLVKRKGRELKGLNLQQRQENVKGRFYLKKKSLSPCRFLLLDDVYTTGATMNECARILKEAGAKEVCGMSLVQD